MPIFQTEINKLNIDDRFKIKIRHDIDYILAANIPGLIMIILYGSCARETTHHKSDVDLLLVINGELPEMIVRGKIYCDMDDYLDGVRTDVVFATNNSYETNTSLFAKQIQRTK